MVSEISLRDMNILVIRLLITGLYPFKVHMRYTLKLSHQNRLISLLNL